MKRVFATLLLTLGGATCPLAAGEPPAPPADLYQSPADHQPFSRTGASPVGEPTPLTPEDGLVTPGDDGAPSFERRPRKANRPGRSCGPSPNRLAEAGLIAPCQRGTMSPPSPRSRCPWRSRAKGRRPRTATR